MPSLHVHYLPQFVPEHELADAAVVVIDLLRASTTVCHALAAGARDVVPYVEVDAALHAAQTYLRSDVLMGGSVAASSSRDSTSATRQPSIRRNSSSGSEYYSPRPTVHAPSTTPGSLLAW